MTRPSIQSRLALLLLIVLAAACGASSRSQQQASPVAVTMGASHYSTDAGSGNAISASWKDELAGVRDVLRAPEPLIDDARLLHVAEALARAFPESVPPRDVLEFLVRDVGLIEPTPHVVMLRSNSRDALSGAIASAAQSLLARGHYTHFGLGIAEHEEFFTATLLVTNRQLRLTALPRAFDVNSRLELRAQVDSELHSPELAVELPDGSVTRVAMLGTAEIVGAVELSAQGRYRVEVLAVGARGVTVLANFPIFVGVPVPSQLAAEPVADSATLSSPDQVAQQLFAAINGTRRQASLPALHWDESVAAVANAHSTDMLEANYVGHDSPRFGNLSARLSRASLSSPLALENIGRGYSSSDIHEGLLASPGHRSNIYNRDVTHIGIGVTAQQEGDRLAFLATQVFIRRNQTVDVASARSNLLASINQNRSRRGLPPLALDEHLTLSAQEGADEYFRTTTSQQDIVDNATAGLRRFAIVYRRVRGLMTVLDDVTSASTLEPLMAEDVNAIGLGITQGSRPGEPPNRLAVAILLGERR